MNDLAEVGGHLLQLAVAFVLAFPIARNREHRERNAGLRILTLVAISTLRVSDCGSEFARARMMPSRASGRGFSRASASSRAVRF